MIVSKHKYRAYFCTTNKLATAFYLLGREVKTSLNNADNSVEFTVAKVNKYIDVTYNPYKPVEQ